MPLNEDAVIQKLLDQDEKLEGISTQIQELRAEMIAHLEPIATIVKRLDEERLAAVHWIERVEETVATHTEEIGKMKETLSV